MKDLATHEKFIELRANNESYQTIAQKLGVSKTTLIQWSKEYKTDIGNMRALSLDALQQQYKVSKQERIALLSNQLQEVRKELESRGLKDIPTHKLLELLMKLNVHLAKEEAPITLTEEYNGLFLQQSPHIETWEG